MLPADFSWWNVVPTLIGAGISMATTAGMYLLNQNRDRTRRIEESNKAGAARALEGYFTLLDYANLQANLINHINKSYSQTRDVGLHGAEPWENIPPMVGQFLRPNRLSAEQIRFLVNKDHIDLVRDIQLVEARVLNNITAFEKFSELREALDGWMDNQPGVVRIFDGVVAQDSIPAGIKPMFDRRVAQLNIILGDLIQNEDSDTKLADRALVSYIAAARDVYGEVFPKLEIADKEIAKC